MDAFDQWWQWAEKPLDSLLTIPAELHEAVMALTPNQRRARHAVNEAVRSRMQGRQVRCQKPGDP